MVITRSTTRWIWLLPTLWNLAPDVELLSAEGYTSSVIMSKLDNPRGLALGPEGGVYVAEAGRGGGLPGFEGGDGSSFKLGITGGVTVWNRGIQQRVISGLPSAAVSSGRNAIGLHDLAFQQDGSLVGLFGLDTDPFTRSQLDTAAHGLGTLARLNLESNDELQIISDLAYFEESIDPDRRGIASNPYGVVAMNDGSFLAADSAGNSLVKVGADGSVIHSIVLPAIQNPLPFGPPWIEPVPTSVTSAGQGEFYVSELTGFPFAKGSANIYHYDSEREQLQIAFSDFTNLIDLAMSEDGWLYALELSSNGLAAASGPGEGVLWQINPTNGDRSIVASDGLSFPTSVLPAPGGVLYVTNFGTSVGKGEVLRIAPHTTRGDFNWDSRLTIEDIDSLAVAIRNASQDSLFDLTEDGTLNHADFETWVELAGTFLGDANLDGSVAFGDFLILAENFGQLGGWASGDFTGDGKVLFPDFLLLSENYGRTNLLATASVPEPVVGWPAWLAAACLYAVRRRCKSR